MWRHAARGGDAENPADPNRSAWKVGYKSFKMIVPYFWPKDEPMLRVRVLVSLAILILARVINVAVPLMLLNAIDALDGTKTPNPYVPTSFILAYVCLRLCSNNLKDARDSIFIHVENHITRIVGLQSFRHLHNLSLHFHLSRNTGAILRIMDRGKAAITSLVGVLGFTIIPTIFEVILTCIVMLAAFKSAWYSVITFLTIASYAGFTIAVTEWRTKYRREMIDKENATSTTALDSILNYETVKYFTTEKHEANRYDKSLLDYYVEYTKSQYSLSLLNVGQGLIIHLGLGVAMGLAAYHVVHGQIDVGDFVAINSYILQLYAPLGWLGTSYRMIITGFTDLEKLFELLEEVPQVKDPADKRKITFQKGDIEFRNISFTYPPRSQSGGVRGDPVLQDINFVIKSGHTLAIVGPSGSGKTTIARLLCRFYDPDTGAVTIDGQDVTKITQLSLRRLIGVVPQDTVLFNDTIRYNIEYGRAGLHNPDFSISVEQAAKEANIHEFIINSPTKYDTIVGERGLRLSGGEKQRVAIARAILKDPPILLLDEATSSLDSKTEREIQGALQQVSKGRTTLIIAHRLSTIVSADEIIVLKKGRILERGNHRELIELGGEYKQMWEIQAKEAQESEKHAPAAPSSSSNVAPLLVIPHQGHGHPH